ncbi:helix-turn-helix domain-containing protein [Lacticaseibacillus zhaodongensis]|uniref:helix-turn-helix domain-containing protein n=1 Tax=Lacticaseibacillus zhaodongensis TaxID=2668065 RepID=UPI0018AFE110|nr:helix-turn-helix transcriptional regulator [Lacticaseibacillus zhaodongensis]
MAYTVEQKKQIGQRISNVRNNMGLTMSEFGRRIGNVSQSIVTRWENGTSVPSAERLKRISEIAGVSTDWLLNGEQVDVAELVYQLGKKTLDEAKQRGDDVSSINLANVFLNQIIASPKSGTEQKMAHDLELLIGNIYAAKTLLNSKKLETEAYVAEADNLYDDASNNLAGIFGGFRMLAHEKDGRSESPNGRDQ